MKILFLRNFANQVNPEIYNLQEIGLAKSLVKLGHQCDIVYYTNDRSVTVQQITVNNSCINVHWVPAMKITNNAIYLGLIKNRFFDKYDVVQTSEYTQIMSFILPLVTQIPIVLYQGPYKDESKKYLHKFYDLFFLKSIRKGVTFALTKSSLAKDYLKRKGFKDVFNIGVGIDTEKLNTERNESLEMNEELKNIKKGGKKVLLYVGKIEERRNTPFLFEVFSLVRQKIPNLKMIIVGNGEAELVNKYFNNIRETDLIEDIVHFKEIKQKDIRQIYELSDIFLLPTKYEIFGMVILESMFFKVPVCTTINGGSVTLIENGENGLIFDGFNSEVWANRIVCLLRNEVERKKMGEKAYETIIDGFTWDELAPKFINAYKKAIEKQKRGLNISDENANKKD